MVSPGLNSPSVSAFSIMYFAIRALIDPDGFRYSSLTQMPSTRISGVLPMASRMLGLVMMHLPAPLAGHRSDRCRSRSASTGTGLVVDPHELDSVFARCHQRSPPSLQMKRRSSIAAAGFGGGCDRAV